MSSSTDLTRAVLRGAAAAQVMPARMDADLRTSPYAGRYGADPRLVAPTLELAFAERVAAAEEEARQRGYADGHREGLEAAAEASRRAEETASAARAAEAAERREALARALVALGRAAHQLEERQATAAPDIEHAVVAAGFALAEVLLGREPATPRDAVARVLRLAPAGQPVTLRLHPSDAAAVDVSEWTGRELVIAPDDRVERGGCIAEAGATRIDGQLSAALARVREALAS
jgi:flagellar assembly protein FliH